MKKLLFLTLTAAVILSACSGAEDNGLSSVIDSGEIAPMEDLSFDWGDIDIEGGDVAHTFRLQNKGSEDLVLKSASTSCMCTNAEITLADGVKSPTFGMHNNPQWGSVVAPGEEFEIRVVFDPMAHGPEATGPIMRSIFLETSSVQNGNYAKIDQVSGSAVTEIKVQGDVLSADDFNNQ